MWQGDSSGTWPDQAWRQQWHEQYGRWPSQDNQQHEEDADGHYYEPWNASGSQRWDDSWTSQWSWDHWSGKRWPGYQWDAYEDNNHGWSYHDSWKEEKTEERRSSMPVSEETVGMGREGSRLAQLHMLRSCLRRLNQAMMPLRMRHRVRSRILRELRPRSQGNRRPGRTSSRPTTAARRYVITGEESSCSNLQLESTVSTVPAA